MQLDGFGLQHLIDICIKYGIQCDITFNPQKTQLACFGGNYHDVNSVTFGAVSLQIDVKSVQLILLYVLRDFAALFNYINVKNLPV